MESSMLVAHFGPHPARRLGLDLTTPDGRDAWLLVCLLLSQRAPEPQILEVASTLARDGLLEVPLLPGRSAVLAATLAAGPWKEPAPLAARMLRVAEALNACGGVDAVETSTDAFEELGEGLIRLAPGVGPATVLRFLRPLRQIWGGAADTPPAPAALAAAACLGWGKTESESLKLPCSTDYDPADLEFALETLGAAACRAGRRPRCPLQSGCALAEA